MAMVTAGRDPAHFGRADDAVEQCSRRGSNGASLLNAVLARPQEGDRSEVRAVL